MNTITIPRAALRQAMKGPVTLTVPMDGAPPDSELVTVKLSEGLIADPVADTASAVDALLALDLDRAPQLEAIGDTYGVLDRLQPEIDHLRAESRRTDRASQLTQKQDVAPPSTSPVIATSA
jgi:hypothetical protein